MEYSGVKRQVEHILGYKFWIVQTLALKNLLATTFGTDNMPLT